jgi:MOSC domain-containing protein YiiM/SAM-dependent methyltransferase
MTEGVHPLVKSFGAAADAYERGRPGYPAEAVDAVVRFLGLAPGRAVLDLGAGTGKLTRLLVPTGARVIAVEPVAGMAARLRATTPGAELLEGTAEAIPLPNGSVVGVVVAQAFHWFDLAPALSEAHRVVEPDGGLVLVYNKRDEGVPWIARLTELLEEATGCESPVETLGWREKMDMSALFEPAGDELEFHHTHRLSREGVLDRVTSVSTVAALDLRAQDELARRVIALLDDDPDTSGRDEIAMPYQTFVLRFRRRSPVPGTEGTIVSVNMNDGGVPKPPVAAARVGRLGLEGDGHHNPDVHGGERAAVCLYAQEAIERVRADGHQAFPGAYGENLTLLGIDWDALRAGDRLALGDGDDGPLLELTQYATPCETQARWFRGGRIGRISHAAHPEDARFYARVLHEGDVAAGMPVRVLPSGAPQNRG